MLHPFGPFCIQDAILLIIKRQTLIAYQAVYPLVGDTHLDGVLSRLQGLGDVFVLGIVPQDAHVLPVHEEFGNDVHLSQA